MDMHKTKSFGCLISLTILSAASFCIVVFFSYLNNIPDNGVFTSSNGNISKKYETDITPAAYAFSIWSLIFSWQMAWLLYAITSIFRKTEQGPLMLNPVVLPASVHLWWIASCMFIVAWLFIWDREWLVLASVDLLAASLCGHTAVFLHSKAIIKSDKQLRSLSKLDQMCVLVLIQNGLDILFSWTTIASFVNIATALTYGPLGFSSSYASTLCLSILGALIFVWSLAENTILFEYFNCVYTWYLILIWALIAIIVKHPDTSNRNTILTILLLSLSIICLVIKIIVFRTLSGVSEKKKL